MPSKEDIINAFQEGAQSVPAQGAKTVQAEGSQVPAINPSREDVIAAFQQGSNPSMMDSIKNTGNDLVNDAGDLSAGAVHGLTFGLDDEIEGAGKAGLEKLGNVLKGKDTAAYSDLFKKYQKNAEDIQEAHKARSPYLYGTGQIAAPIAAALLTAGGSAAAAGAGLTLKEAASLGLPTLAKELATRAAPGAVYGGLQGFGDSKGDITTMQGLGQRAQDTAMGSATGGVLSTAGTSLVGNRGVPESLVGEQQPSAFSKLMSDHPDVRRIIKSFKRGTQGKGYGGDQVEAELQQNLTGAADNVANKFVDARNTAASGVGHVVSKSGAELESTPIIEQAQAELGNLVKDQRTLEQSREFDQLRSIYNKYGKTLGPEEQAPGQIATDVLDNSGQPRMKTVPSEPIQTPSTPQEMYDLRAKLIEQKQNTTEPVLLKVINQSLNDIEAQLSQVPGYRQSMQNLKSVAGVPEQVLGKTLQDYGSQAPSVLSDQLKEIARRAGGAGANDRDIISREQLANMQKGLMDLEEKNPGLLKSLGIENHEELFNPLKEAGEQEEIRQQIVKKAPSGSIMHLPYKVLGFGAETGAGAGLQLSNKVGQAVNLVKKVPGLNSVASFGKSLYEAPPAALHQVSNVLRSSGFEHYGDALEKGMQNKDQAAVNAAIFTILQNPKARQLLNPTDQNQ